MLNKVKIWFHNLRLRYLIWKKERAISEEFNKNTSYTMSSTEYQEDVIQRAIGQGVGRIKNKINNMVKNGDNYDTALRKTELLSLAENEEASSKNLTDNLKEVYVYKQEKPKNEMIADRISHYYELQQAVLKRREVRKNRKTNK